MHEFRRIKKPKGYWGLPWPFDICKGSGPMRGEAVRRLSKRGFYLLLISVLTLCLTSCAPRARVLADTDDLPDHERAQHILSDFLDNLHAGKYGQAARVYAGSYQTMIDQNPGRDASDHTTLLENACTTNGMQCLQAKIIGLEDEIPHEKYVFLVEFLKLDGTLFKLGPCCGEDKASSTPQSVFLFTVIKTGQNTFTVMDTPPYLP